jgi:hypothetical protein
VLARLLLGMRHLWEVHIGSHHPPPLALSGSLASSTPIQVWVTPPHAAKKEEEVMVDSLTFEWMSSEDYSHDPHMKRVNQVI